MLADGKVQPPLSTAIAYADAALAVVKRDILVFRSYRMRFPAQVGRSCLAVALFYYISRLVTVAPFSGPDAYFAFAVVGLVIVELMFSTLSGLPGRVRHEIVAGTFERFVVSPFGPVAAVLSLSVFPLLLALASGTITLSFAGLVFGMPVRWETLPLAVPIAFVGCLSFVSLGAIAAAAVILVKETQGGVGLLTTGIAFVSGFLFPVALLPDWIEWTSQVQPFTPVARAAPQRDRRHADRRFRRRRARQDRRRGRRPALLRHLAARPRDPRKPAPRDDHRVLSDEEASRHQSDERPPRPSLPVADHVVYRAFALETVVVNLERGVYHGLNPTAGECSRRSSERSSAREAAAVSRRGAGAATGSSRGRPCGLLLGPAAARTDPGGA